jgi:hypothetical protein
VSCRNFPVSILELITLTQRLEVVSDQDSRSSVAMTLSDLVIMVPMSPSLGLILWTSVMVRVSTSCKHSFIHICKGHGTHVAV